MKYDILKISMSNYMRIHWDRTEDARKKLRMDDVEWKFIWTKNYYQEKCEALEKKLNENENKNKN
jgi:hypothetical protein